VSIRAFKNILPTIHDSAYIDEQSCVIGDVKIAEDVSIWPMTVVRGDVNTIAIGKKTNVQDGSVLHVTHESATNNGYPLMIGEGVTVGHKAMLHACEIKDYCLIGMGAIVLDGAIVEEHVLVGANSLVPPGKRLESGYLWLGSPVKKIRALSEKEIAWFEYSANHYVKLKNEYLGY
jgi:carbonic anhydrase/acetyltransferase-like protein (isoleucine patch superfamily)